MAYVNLTLLLRRKQLIACFSEIRGGKQFIENLLCAAQEIFYQKFCPPGREQSGFII